MCVYLYIYIHVCMGALPGQPALRLCPRRPGAYIDMCRHVFVCRDIHIYMCVYLYIYTCVCMGALPGQPALRLCPRRPGAYIDVYI